jgi:hypothetical protein
LESEILWEAHSTPTLALLPFHEKHINGLFICRASLQTRIAKKRQHDLSLDFRRGRSGSSSIM